MKLSLIILNYQSEKLIRYCVQDIRKAHIALPHEIIVVNNDSKQALDSIRHHLGGATVIQAEKNNGFSSGNNLGIQQSKGEYVLILNPDIMIEKGSIEALARFLDEHPKVALVGPKLVNPDRSLQYSAYRFPSRFQDFLIPIYARTPLGRLGKGKKVLEHYLMKNWDHQETRVVDWILGAAMLIRRSFIEKQGGFDERFFLYNEDMDLCMRAWISGWEVWYDPQAAMTHLVERMLPEQVWYQNVFDTHTWIHSISWLKFFWKWRKVIFKKQESRVKNHGIT